MKFISKYLNFLIIHFSETSISKQINRTNCAWSNINFKGENSGQGKKVRKI